MTAFQSMLNTLKRTSAMPIAQHFLECENAQLASKFNNLYDRLTNTHFDTNTISCLKTLINNNCKIVYHNNSLKNNQLLLHEALITYQILESKQARTPHFSLNFLTLPFLWGLTCHLASCQCLL